MSERCPKCDQFIGIPTTLSDYYVPFICPECKSKLIYSEWGWEVKSTPHPARSEGEKSSPPTRRPKIICLCGSTKFKKAFEDANWYFTSRGAIVLSVGCFMHADKKPVSPELKEKLDELHLRKIDLADQVHVLNIGGYIGESTQREIVYANQHKKILTYEE